MDISILRGFIINSLIQMVNTILWNKLSKHRIGNSYRKSINYILCTLTIKKKSSASATFYLLPIWKSQSTFCHSKITIYYIYIGGESHKTFLSKCYRDKIIPHGLSIYVEPSIGNQDEAFLETWHENLQSFSLTLMSQVITFCDRTINKVNEKIEKTKVELHAKLDRNEREEIISILEKNDELNRKHLQQRKTKKFNYLKFKPKNQSPSEENEEIIHTEKRTNEHQKPSYAAVLKRRSNTNLRRKFGKQNLAQNEQNSSVKNSILNARRSHSSNRNTPTEVPTAKQTENNKNEVLQNEIEILKKEIESMKKDHSVVSKIPTRRQLLPYPPSKLSPQKTAVETTPKESKNGNAASVDGGQKQHQIKQVIKFLQSTMQTL